MDDEMHVLYVGRDDDPPVADRIPAHAPVSVDVVTEGVLVLDELSTGDVDCIVSEQSLPGLDGVEVLRLVRDADPDVPFVLFVADGSEQLATEAISAGVTEYVRRDGDPGADAAELATTIHDAASTYRAQQDVAMLNDLARNVYERITDAFFAVDRNWNFTYLNQEAEELLDVKAEAVIGENLWDVFPDAVGSTFYTEYHRAMATQDPVTFTEFFPPLDRTFQVRAFPSEDGLSVHFRRVVDGADAAESDHLMELTSILTYDLMDSIEAVRADVEAAQAACTCDNPDLEQIDRSLERMTDLVNHSMRLANDR